MTGFETTHAIVNREGLTLADLREFVEKTSEVVGETKVEVRKTTTLFGADSRYLARIEVPRVVDEADDWREARVGERVRVRQRAEHCQGFVGTLGQTHNHFFVTDESSGSAHRGPLSDFEPVEETGA